MVNEDIKDKNEKIGNEIKTATRTSLFQRLAARFGFGIKKSTNKNQSSFTIIKKPTQAQLDSKGIKDETDLVNQLFKTGNLSSTIQDLFDDWVNDTQNTYANIQEREERINAFTYMCDNEGIIKSAVNLTASEVASLIDNTAFTVISEDENWQEEINMMLKSVWKYDQPTIYSLAWNIFLYGEAFQGREVSSAGIVGINTIKVNEILERLEFKPAEVANFNMQAQAGSGSQSSGFTVNLTMPTNSSFGSSNLNFNFSPKRVTYKSTDNLLKDYIQNITDISTDEYFTSHLLGYRVYNDMLVAPWQVSHFRFNESVSEFWPYGQPLLLSCLSAYKQLQRVMGLDDLKSLLSMPIHMYKVKTNGATTARAFDIVNTVKEEFENVGLISTSAGLEGPSLCTNIWTSDDLVTVETVKSENTGSDNTDKMKFFYDRLQIATGIPRSYLDPSAEGFQMSGVALSALFKPFRTLVETIRGIIIAEVEDTIRLHDSIRGVETPDFVLSMNVVNPVATEDASSKLQLSDTVLDTIAMLLGVEDKNQLPILIKKDVLTKYTNMTSTEIENYINILNQNGLEKINIDSEELNADFGDASEANEDFDSEEESEETVEENFIKDKKNRLIETRYKSAKPSTIKYYLVEQLNKLDLPTSTNHFCEKCNSKATAEEINFLKNSFKKKHGKKKIHS